MKRTRKNLIDNFDDEVSDLIQESRENSEYWSEDDERQVERHLLKDEFLNYVDLKVKLFSSARKKYERFPEESEIILQFLEDEFREIDEISKTARNEIK